MNWYVLYTAPRAEKKVEKRLKGEGFEVFLPLYKSKRKWSDRIKEVELPLFSSYVFIRCLEHKLSGICAIPGIVRVVYYVGRPAIIRDSEIEAIHEFLSLADKNQVIEEGDIVRAIGTPIEKYSGMVVRINEKYSYLYIEALGATVYTETSKLEKQEQ